MSNKIHFTGDISLCREITEFLDDVGYDPFRCVRAVFQNDLVIANMEQVLFDGEIKNAAEIPLRLESKYLAKFKGINWFFCLANNHIDNFGAEGVQSTMRELGKHEYPYVGVGKNFEDASNPATIELDGLKIGVLSFILRSNGLPKDDFTHFYCSEKYLLRTIDRKSKQYDFFVVIPHWGGMFRKFPYQWQVEMARGMIDKGADAVIGHHPHVVQPILWYRNKPIFFSLGNFIFDAQKFEKKKLDFKGNDDRYGLCVSISFNKTKSTYSWFFTEINTKYEVEIQQNIELKKRYERMNTIFNQDPKKYAIDNQFYYEEKLSYYRTMHWRAFSKFIFRDAWNIPLGKYLKCFKYLFTRSR